MKDGGIEISDSPEEVLAFEEITEIEKEVIDEEENLKETKFEKEVILSFTNL